MICAVWQGLKVPVFQNVDGAGVVHRIYFLFSEWYINGLPNTHLLGSDLLSRKTMVIQFLRNVGQTFKTMCIDSFSSVLPQDVCMFLLLILTNLHSPSCSKRRYSCSTCTCMCYIVSNTVLSVKENSYFQFC